MLCNLKRRKICFFQRNPLLLKDLCIFCSISFLDSLKLLGRINVQKNPQVVSIPQMWVAAVEPSTMFIGFGEPVWALPAFVNDNHKAGKKRACPAKWEEGHRSENAHNLHCLQAGQGVPLSAALGGEKNHPCERYCSPIYPVAVWQALFFRQRIFRQ